MRAGWEMQAGAWPARGSSELQQLADLNVAVGWQPVGPLEGGVHVGQIHDVEGLNLPFTFGVGSALHRPVERVPSYRGLNVTSVARGRSECTLEYERAVGLHLLVEIDPGSAGRGGMRSGLTHHDNAVPRPGSTRLRGQRHSLRSDHGPDADAGTGRRSRKDRLAYDRVRPSPAVNSQPRGNGGSTPVGPEAHGGSNYDRPGDEWGAGYLFTTAGCWHLHAQRTTGSADVWLEVAPK